MKDQEAKASGDRRMAGCRPREQPRNVKGITDVKELVGSVRIGGGDEESAP